MRLRLVIALSLVVPAAAALATDGAWEKVSDHDGIVVYAKNLDGVATISLRGEAVIEATVDDIFDVMKDNQAAHEWMPLVAEKRDLKAISATQRVEYTHVAMPWPMTDRYFVSTGTMERLPDGTMKIFVKSVENPELREDDKVLGDLKYSEFLLIPEAGGSRTRLKLEVNTDPKGLIPKFLVNSAQKSWPRDFLNGLRKQLAKRGKLKTAAMAH
jgi:hypothetical protein